MRLCSDFDPEHRVTCDLPEGHKGLHEARLLWGEVEYPPPTIDEEIKQIGQRYA